MEQSKIYKNKNDHSNNQSFRSEFNTVSQQPQSMFNTPLLEINSSVIPLKNDDDDRQQFLLEGSQGKLDYNNSNQISPFVRNSSQNCMADLNYIKGAEQRQKLFTQFRYSDKSEQKLGIDDQQEIISPSLTSNSNIIKIQDEKDGYKADSANNKSDNQSSYFSSKLNQKNITSQQKESKEMTIHNSKISSLSLIEQRQQKNNKQKQNEIKNQEQQQVSGHANSWNGDSIPNIPIKMASGQLFQLNETTLDKNQSAVNTFSDVSVNIFHSNVQRGQIEDNIFNEKSSLSNAIFDSQLKVNIDQDYNNRIMVLNGFHGGKDSNRNNQSESQNNSNYYLLTKNNNNSMNFANMEIKTLDITGQNNYGEKRRGSNVLEIPSPSNFGGTYNQTSYNRKNSNKSQISQKVNNKSKQRNFLKAFFFAYKFLQKMRFIRKFKNIYSLEKKHFKLIKDNAFGDLYERSGHRNVMSRIINNSNYFLFDIKSPFHAFQPNSLPLLIFELSIFAILMFLVFYIPIQVCFSHVPGFPEVDGIKNFINIVPYIFMLEILINLNTAYYSQGTTVNDRKLIIKNYLSFKFWVDIFTIICLQSPNIIPLLFILRVYQIFKILYDFDETFQIQYKFPTTFELTKLVLIIIFVAHICACGFHLILDYQPTDITTWVDKSNLSNKSWIEIYVAALYFSYTTMITVGFGDIVPYTLLERVYVIFVQVISCGVFAYSINTIGSNFFNDILTLFVNKYFLFDQVYFKKLQEEVLSIGNLKKILNIICLINGFNVFY